MSILIKNEQHQMIKITELEYKYLSKTSTAFEFIAASVFLVLFTIVASFCAHGVYLMIGGLYNYFLEV